MIREDLGSLDNRYSVFYMEALNISQIKLYHKLRDLIRISEMPMEIKK